MSWIERVKRVLLAVLTSRPFLWPLAKVFRLVAMTGRGGNLCLRHGFLPVPVHFYSPVPDLADLDERGVWDKRSSLPGIEFKPESQVMRLLELGERYRDECRWPAHDSGPGCGFHLENQVFSYRCAAVTHSMIRRYHPSRILEIGSGMSSRVISEAITRMRREEGHACEYTVVDPYPGPELLDGRVEATRVIVDRVERVAPALFDGLGSGDILFIDTGHCVRIGGDVNWLYLEVLPRLKPGVIVHAHDMALPYEYPKAYATRETFRQFWTEQYLLQAFLCYNRAFEVLLAMTWLSREHREVVQRAFPSYDAACDALESSSFWMRRVP